MKKLLLFIVAMLATSVIGKAQLTLTVDSVRTVGDTVTIPVYITGADATHKVSLAYIRIAYDTTKLMPLTTQNFFDTTMASTIKKNSTTYYSVGISETNWKINLWSNGSIDCATDVDNFDQGTSLSFRNGAKTKLFEIVAVYTGSVTTPLTWNNPVSDPMYILDSANNEYTLTFVNGAVSRITTLSGPTLLSPADLALNTSLTPTLTWTSVSGSTGYAAQISTDSTFATTVASVTSLTDTTYTLSSSLLQGTTYYWRAGSITSGPTTTWSASFNRFTTKTIVAPTLTTSAATAITTTGATVGGEITLNNGTISERGVIYSDASNVTWNNKAGFVASLMTTDVFSSALSGLNYTTTYYARAYASNESGRSLGNEISFTTLTPIYKATLTTNSATSVDTTSAVCGGNITNAGNGTVSSRGLIYGTATGVDTLNYAVKLSLGSGTGSFTSPLTLLVPNTTYFVKAYAVNEAGYGLGNEISFTTLHSIVLPTLTIASAATNITDMAAVVDAAVTDLGYGVVSDRGLIYSKTAGVTMSNKLGMIANGAGLGSFTTNISGLTANTTYYVKAYAINQKGVVLSNEISFKTTLTITVPTVTTTSATNITMNTAVTGGNVTSANNGNVSAKGVVYGLNANVSMTSNTGYTSDGMGLGSFTSNLSGLDMNTTYYVKAYGLNEAGIGYGSAINFTTLTQVYLPTVLTYNVSAITTTSAVASGNVTSAGNGSISDKGLLYNTSAGVSLTNKLKQVSGGTGVGPFSTTFTNLTSNTNYFVVAYAINEAGTKYGQEVTFTTLQGIVATLPTVTTTAASTIKATTAICGGTVVSDGASTVSVRGIVWNTTSGVTLSNKLGSSAINRTGLGSFYSSLSGLAPNTTFYFKAYGTNTVGVGYGSEMSFTTLATLATVTTGAVSSISQNTATVAGTINAVGASNLTDRGVVYSTESGYGSYTKVSNGSSIGSYSVDLTGLNANTNYFVKAFGTNSYGTGYGLSVSFTTLSNPSLVFTVNSLASSYTPRYAAGALDVLSYSVSGGAFGTNNTIVAELSNASGDFTSPTVVGTTVSTTSGTIAISLPYTLTNGSGYRIRLRATNPNMTTTNTSAALTIKPIKDYLTETNPSTCSGVSKQIGLTNVTFEGANRYTYTWSSAALLDNSTVKAPQYLSPTTGKTFTVYFVPVKAGEQITSKDVTVSITTPTFTVSLPSTFSIVAYAVGSGNVQTLAAPTVSGTVTGSLVYTWYANSVSASNVISNITNCNFNVGANVYYMVATDGSGCSQAAKKFTVYRRAYKEGDMAFGANKNSFMQVYPTPCENELTLDGVIGEATTATAKLVDILGNVVLEKTISSADGIVNQSLDLSSIQTGSYVLMIETANDLISTKVVKVK